MKRILFILALMLNAVYASSQTITRVETLKSLNFGCQKFCALITNNDTTFVIKVKQAYGRDSSTSSWVSRKTEKTKMTNKHNKGKVLPSIFPTSKNENSLSCLVVVCGEPLGSTCFKY